MKRSRYKETGTTCDLESFGIVETECKTIGEFVDDVLYDGRYEFKVYRNVWHMSRKFHLCVGYFFCDDKKIECSRDWLETANLEIREIKYIDGYGGSRFTIEAKPQFE